MSKELDTRFVVLGAAEKAVAAAEPFIRELVIAQVVEALTAARTESDTGGDIERGTGYHHAINLIEREFGGSR